MSGKSAKDYEGDYTDPQLRERLKEEIKAGDRGGRKGQWSARKSQLLTHDYEAQGGGYEHPGERSAGQRSLEQWTDEDWHTREGGADARHGGSTDRYLPDAAWQLLSAAEQKATDSRKRNGHDQHVANTDAAKAARTAAGLLERSAKDAVSRVRSMDSPDELDRALRAERDLGRARKTVLEAIERRQQALG